jgi:hypothetical protein
MKRRPYITGAVLTASIILALLCQTACKAPDDKEVKASIELLDIKTSWMMKEYRQWPNPKLTLVPTVSFRVKNLTADSIRFVNINAIFREREANENLGDCFKAAIGNEGLPAGETSPVVIMKSNFGVEGKTLDSFKSNPQWRSYYVKLFAQMKGSRHVPLGEWPVSRQIDFQEDKPAYQDKKLTDEKKTEPVKK